MQPTEKQREEFWEWCGFHLIENVAVPYWVQPDGRSVTRSEDMPKLDLNNLFKYAVPKLIETNTYFMMCYSRPQNEFYCQCGLSSEFNEDPALALFWAIYKVIKC